MNKRTIRKITVQDKGLKGLIISGTEEVMKDNKTVINGFVDTLKFPIHADLEQKIADLRIYALEVCGLTNEDAKDLKKQEKFMLHHGAEVLSFEFEQGVLGWMKIKCSSRVFDSKTQNITTPKIDINDKYELFEPMMTNLDEILEEVKLYVSGQKKVTDEEFMLTYVRLGKDKNVTMDALNEMNAEERADYCQSVLEKYGCLVIRPDEVSDEDVEEEVVEETEGTESGDLFDASNMNISEMDIEAKEKLKAPFADAEGTPLGELRVAEPIKLKK